MKLADKNLRKIVVTALSLALLLIGTSLTMAYLNDRTDTARNNLQFAHVSCQVEETFSNGTKSNVSIKNTSDTDAYIRVILAAVWLNADGDITAPAVATPVFTATNWFVQDGIYYYELPLAPDESTTDLIGSFPMPTPMPTQTGLTYELQIIASAIQATPEAVSDAWGVSVSSGLFAP